jgi:hypothetical protein
MRNVLKTILVAMPALLIAATVGLSTMGCDDTAMPPPADLAVSPPKDMAVAPGDMAKTD